MTMSPPPGPDILALFGPFFVDSFRQSRLVPGSSELPPGEIWGCTCHSRRLSSRDGVLGNTIARKHRSNKLAHIALSLRPVSMHATSVNQASVLRFRYFSDAANRRKSVMEYTKIKMSSPNNPSSIMLARNMILPS